MSTNTSNKFSLCESQIPSLNLPIGSIVPIEITNPTGKVSAAQVGDKVGFTRIPSVEFGQITILEDGYSLRLDSDDEKIIEAYEYLQELVSKGYKVRFALVSDRPSWYVWQEKSWHYSKTTEGVKTLFIDHPYC